MEGVGGGHGGSVSRFWMCKYLRKGGVWKKSLGGGGAFCRGGNTPLPTLALQGQKPCMNGRCLEFSNSKGRDNFEIMRVCICNWEALDWKLVSSSENNRKCMNRCKENLVFGTETFREIFLNAVYFRRGLTCTLGLTNDLIDGGQPRAKPCLRKAKLSHVLKPGFSIQSHGLLSCSLTQEYTLDFV